MFYQNRMQLYEEDAITNSEITILKLYISERILDKDVDRKWSEAKSTE